MKVWKFSVSSVCGAESLSEVMSPSCHLCVVRTEAASGSALRMQAFVGALMKNPSAPRFPHRYHEVWLSALERCFVLPRVDVFTHPPVKSSFISGKPGVRSLGGSRWVRSRWCEICKSGLCLLNIFTHPVGNVRFPTRKVFPFVVFFFCKHASGVHVSPTRVCCFVVCFLL